MARDASGTYTLPAGNPVVTNTTITSTWANSTASDIGSELTSSLDRSGRGGMLAQLKAADGVVANPGITFLTDLTTGIARLAANTMSLVVAGVEVTRISATGFSQIFPWLFSSIRNTKSAPAITVGVLTCDTAAQSYFDVALNANITTLTFSNIVASGTVASWIITFTADGTLRTITWPASIKWANGIAAPTMTSTNGKQDSFLFETRDGGTTIIASIRWQNT